MVRLSINSAFGEWRHYQDYYPDVMLPTYSVLLIIIIRQLFSQATVGLIHSFMWIGWADFNVSEQAKQTSDGYSGSPSDFAVFFLYFDRPLGDAMSFTGLISAFRTPVSVSMAKYVVQLLQMSTADVDLIGVDHLCRWPPKYRWTASSWMEQTYLVFSWTFAQSSAAKTPVTSSASRWLAQPS